MTDTHGNRYYRVLLFIVPLLFFWKTWVRGLLPIPADALVGLYHPFRDYFADQYPNGIPYKNYLLTDPVLQQYPWKWLATEQWKQGKIPWENPYDFSGAPLLANPQSGSLYPLNVLFFFGPFHPMWTIYIILQPILAGFFLYLFLKSLSLSSVSSLFGGLVWTFSSFNLVWLEWGNIGHAGMWLPLALYAIEKLRMTNDPPASANSYTVAGGSDWRARELRITKWNFLFLLSLLMSFLAGHPQVFLYVIIATTLYWFLRLGISKRSVILLTTYYLLLTTLTVPQWYPTLQFARQSNRAAEQHDVLRREGFFIEPKHLVQLIAPDFFGNPATGNYRGVWNYAEQIIYVGLLPLLLAVFSLISFDLFAAHRARPYRAWPFSIMLVIGSLMLSVRSPISELPYRFNIPIWSELQPTRLSFLTTFGLSILAALGLERLVKKSDGHEKRLLVIGAATVSILFALLVVGSKFSPNEKLISQRNLIFPAILLIGGGVGIWGIRVFGESWKLKSSFVLLLTAYYLLLTTIFDLFRFGWKFTPFSPKEYLYPVTPAIHFLQTNMDPDDRYMTLDRRILPPNANIMYGLKSIEGYDPLYSKEYAQLVTEMESGRSSTEPGNFGRIVRPVNFRSPIVQDLKVRYVLGLVDVNDPMLRLVLREGETRVYEIIE